MPDNQDYQVLEPSITNQLGVGSLSFSTNGVVSFATSVSLLWTLGILACVAATGFVFVKGGLFRMQASEAGIRKSNDEFKRGALGLLGVLSLFLLIFTINKGLLVGDVGLSALQTSVSAGGTTGGLTAAIPASPAAGAPAGSGSTATNCATPQAVQSSITSGNVCGNTTCRVLAGCNYQQYLPIINAQGLSPDMVKNIIVIMCRESRAQVNANRRNQNGTYDCGLMQVNQATPCDASSFDPATNISKAVALIRNLSNSSSVRQTYPGVPATAGLFASYNCCANGTVPNSPSASCNSSTGFTTSLPKWACPLDPGTGSFNMCTVKSYACELTACLNSL